MNKTLDKLLLLLWKNWTLQRRRKKKLALDVLLPFLVAALLLYIRYSTEIKSVSVPIRFGSFDPGYIPENPPHARALDEYLFMIFNARDASGLSQPDFRKLFFKNVSGNIPERMDDPRLNFTWTLVWSPDHPVIGDIMMGECEKRNMKGLAMKSSDSLEKIMTVPSDAFPRPRDEILAGVVFPDEISKLTDIPPEMKVTIRFPGELRYSGRSSTGALPQNWQTSLGFPIFQLPGPREMESKEGGSPGYYKEGFLGVQEVVLSSMLKYRMRDVPGTKTLNVTLKRFPYSEFILDPLLLVMQGVLPLMIVVVFLFSVNTIVEGITTEKEKKLKVVMSIMGLSDSVRWTSWFIHSFLFFFFLVIVLLIAFKVPMVSERPVFPHSDWSCLLLFFVCFCFAATTYCFLLSTIFSKASIASIVAGMAWFLLFIPFYVIQEKYAETSTPLKCLSSLLLNTGLGIGIHIILIQEGAGTGIQWSNLSTPAMQEDGMSVAVVMLFLILDCFIYLTLALYIENVFPGEFGTPLPWYYPFQRSYWFREVGNDPSETGNASEEANSSCEDEPESVPAGIRIKNLKKVYGNAKKPAVNNLCLNAYEGQITVLMGFNGAGKTTTLSILTGICSPTSGKATIAGYDVKTNLKESRENLGFCPQHNILFDQLNVVEHLKFFGKLRGLEDETIKKETEKYVQLLNLSDKRETLAQNLSGGMKRKLSVALAMCGNTKVLLFDEPTAGMDPRAKRSLWDLLISKKKGRSILITSHHLDEADVLGDRVAIMSEGSLKCCGSTFFLKKQFSCGYHLIIVKKEGCDTEKISELVRSHIPDDVKIQDVGMELSYQLPEEFSHKFQDLFKALETGKEELKITSFGVSPTSLEDVFMRIANEVTVEGKEEEEEESERDKTLVVSKKEDGITGDYKVNIPDSRKATGFSLVWNQILAMLYKHAKVSIRLWKSYLILVLITASGIGAGIATIKINSKVFMLPPRDLDLQDFPNGIVSVKADESCTGECSNYFESYKTMMRREEKKVVEVSRSQSIDDYFIGECNRDIQDYRKKHVLGALFASDEEEIKITGWFNDAPYHIPPVALSAIYNSVFKTLDVNQSVTFVNEPLPYREETEASIQGSGLDPGFQISIFAASAYIFVLSSFVTFPIQEREVKAKLLQFVAGVSGFIFWIVAYVWDLIRSIGPNASLLITLVIFQQEGFREPEDLGYCAFIIFSLFISALPLTYFASHFFSRPALGFIIMSFLHVFTGIYAVLLVVVLRIPILDLEDVADALDWIFSIFPLFSMSRSFQNIKKSSVQQKSCSSIRDEYCSMKEAYNHTCCIAPGMCESSICSKRGDPLRDWGDTGLGKYVFFLYITGLVHFVTILMMQYGLFNIFKFRRGKPPADSLTDEKDSDVAGEREKIMGLDDGAKKRYNLLIDGLSKTFGKYVAVNNLYLSVKEGECFGLLGTNGAGKTTTFRMLTGDEYPSSGNAYVKGLSLRTDMTKVYRQIGYCPQFDAFIDELTGREHLRLYCLIRGIPKEDIEEVSTGLARDLLFEQYLDKRVGEYSGGNKRKLSTAISVIGNPPILYLDEPTAGIDPAAKRHLWALLSKIRAGGTTVILTSHSLEECEALCTRVAIMVKGEFRCLGTTQYLKSKFCQGYSLAIKVRKQKKENSDAGVAGENEGGNLGSGSYIEGVKRFVEENFENAVRIEEHEDLLVYKLQSSDLEWSDMFGMIESVKNRLNIEDYLLGQTTLEQVLLKFAGSDDTED